MPRKAVFDHFIVFGETLFHTWNKNVHSLIHSLVFSGLQRRGDEYVNSLSLHCFCSEIIAALIVPYARNWHTRVFLC